MLLPLQGEIAHPHQPQGVALGYVLLGFQPVWHVIADIIVHATYKYPPGLCREQLPRGLCMFPHSSYFLSNLSLL